MHKPNEVKGALFKIKRLYLEMPLVHPGNVEIKLSDIPDKLISQYNLLKFVDHDWIYFEIRRGIYGLLQSRILANKLLKTRLNTAGYYHAATSPGLW